jgi:hypothetical protein
MQASVHELQGEIKAMESKVRSTPRVRSRPWISPLQREIKAMETKVGVPKATR